MPSRMERYYDSSDKTVTRTKRNRSLYDEIYEEKEYTNVEGIVKTPATENIDIEKIREMMRKYEDGEKVRTKRIDKTPKIEEIMEEDTPKNYDINDVLNKAMAEKKGDETTYHSLKNTEYNILKFLTKNKGNVYSIEQIYKNVWEEECYGAENIIAVHIRHIREKIEINPREPKYLKVIWGIGYKIEKFD